MDPVANQDGTTSFGAWLSPVSGRLDAGLLMGRKSDGSSTASFTVSTAVATSGPAARGDRFGLSYDLNGNLLTRSRGPIPGVLSGPGSTTETVSYQWDAMNNLVKITYPDGGRTEIRRDIAGRPQRLVEYNSGGGVQSFRQFLWDGARPSEEVSLTVDDGEDMGIALRRFYPQGQLVLDPYGWNYVAYHYIRDHLGSIRAVTNEEGEVVARYDYDPYGKPHMTWHNGELDYLTWQPIEFDFLFTGHLYHERSGLYFAPFRAYDPEIGRWISRDPIDVAGGINLYEYVSGDPVNAVDPWGLLTGQVGASGEVMVFGMGASAGLGIVSGWSFPYQTELQGGVLITGGVYTVAQNRFHAQGSFVVSTGFSTFDSPADYSTIDTNWSFGYRGVGYESGMSRQFPGRRSHNVIAGVTAGGERFPVTLSRFGFLPSERWSFNKKCNMELADDFFSVFTNLYYWTSEAQTNRNSELAKGLRKLRESSGIPITPANPYASAVSDYDGATASTVQHQ